MTDEGGERFAAVGTRVMGGIGLALAAVVAAIGLVTDASYHPAIYAGCALAASLFWAAMLRPAVHVTGGRLVLRNMLDTVSVPLTAVDQVSVRQYLAIGVGGRRYTNSGVGRSRRQSMRDERKADEKEPSYGGFVEARLQRLVSDARERQRFETGSDHPSGTDDVRREPAWLEIGLVAASALALLVTILL